MLHTDFRQLPFAQSVAHREHGHEEESGIAHAVRSIQEAANEDCS